MNILLITLLEEINPLGLLHLSTFLKDNGNQVTTAFVPLNPKEELFGIEGNRVISDHEISETLDLIAEKKPDLFGMTLMTTHYYSAVKLTKKVKETFPEIPIVWGGVHPTLLPEECIEYADIVCRGEGEGAMLELVKHLENGESIENIGSLWVRDKDKITRNEIKPLTQDMDSLGFPRFDWENNYVLYDGKMQNLNKSIYQQCVPRKGRIYDVLTIRGCPYRCSYCSNSSFHQVYKGKGKIVRGRSIESILEELEYVKKEFDFVGIINFQDDVFLVKRDEGWLENFCNQYKEKIGLTFACKGSPREVSEENISLLKKGGLGYFQIGIQGSDRVNREIYNRTTSSRNKIIEASRVLHKHKVVANFDVILDDPFATDEDTLEVIDTLTKIKKPFLISCFSMTFFPATVITKMAKERGLFSKGKDGYILKATQAKRTYLNNLVEIAPRLPAFVIRTFVKHRGEKLAKVILDAYIYIHFNIIFKIMYSISKYPRLLSFLKKIRYSLSTSWR
ncbi:Fe-S oxidoreductase [Candidatus Scalindua japonica]|uniref:Fe-S oxidoreductase n=1 Tax=Candidatus Scalindua japonica TaxID=1284222 RepID=A0A286TX02_9BACT|nr:radical SAM protein [Candidatus Scalindua japonica]GAX60414.1 Fe-S oxidoreductase [Candidatus Scalindua japonica]